MSKGDIIYGDVIYDVYKNGEWDYDAPVRTVWADGELAYTKSLLNVQMKFDNSTDTLESMLTQKRVPTKDPINELFWIWLYKSNNVKFLREYLGCHVWDEWERPDNTIGKAYGWQLKHNLREVQPTKELFEMVANGEISKIRHPNNGSRWDKRIFLDQVDYLIYILKTNPYSRRIKTTLWKFEDLNDMALEPCVYETHWQMWGGKLHLTVNVRSNDLGLGNPYNIYQYSVLHRLIGHVTEKKVGTICFNIDNAHIYDRHMDELIEQINRPMHDAPKIEINQDIKSFYDFTADDIKIIDYKFEKGKRLEVAI